MFTRTRRGWAAACAVGFGTLFLAFTVGGWLQSLFRPDYWPLPSQLSSFDPVTNYGGLDPELASEMYRAALVYHLIHIPLFGAVIGWLQTKVLRTPQVRTAPWVILTALGFLSIFVFEAMRPGIVSGGHPAPAEPLLIAVGGGTLAGVLQWLYLRRQNIIATKWLGLWVAGLCAGAGLAALFLTLLGPLGPFIRSVVPEERFFSVSQFVFYLVYGPTVGVVAGFVSGRAIMEALPGASGRGPEMEGEGFNGR